MIRLIDVYNGSAVRPRALEVLYELLAERPDEAAISHKRMPGLLEHVDFVNSRPHRFWYLIEAERVEDHDDTEQGAWVTVGAISATDRNEIGIAILKAHQRCGYAAQAIAQVMLQYEPLPAEAGLRSNRWLANIATRNLPSIALFEGLGGKPIQITYEL